LKSTFALLLFIFSFYPLDRQRAHTTRLLSGGPAVACVGYTGERSGTDHRGRNYNLGFLLFGFPFRFRQILDPNPEPTVSDEFEDTVFIFKGNFWTCIGNSEKSKRIGFGE
jgi:hypothetical protein